MTEKQSKWRFFIIAGGSLLFVMIGFVGWIWSSMEQNKSQEQSLATQDGIYAYIPWRSGAVTLDPQWRTTFGDLGLANLDSLKQLPTAPATLDPWENSLYRVSQVFLQPGDLSGDWSIAVGHGFVHVRIGETIFLYRDTIGLEELLLRQGIEHGFLTDMQTIFPERDFTDLQSTAVNERPD